MQTNNIHIDYELLIQLHDGDEKAFSLVFESYHKYLYVLACRYLMSDNSAVDAVKYTFMGLWERRGTFDYRTEIKSLLISILKSYILNEISQNNIVIRKNYELAQLTEEKDIFFLSEFEDADFKSHFYRLNNQNLPQKRKVFM